MGPVSAYTQITHAVHVSVFPFYLTSHSRPKDNFFAWACHIRLENTGSETLQLVKRYWRITDAWGRIHESQRRGGIGEQPLLHPGESFEYASGVSLTFPSGIMLGGYHMHNSQGEDLEVPLPPFFLDSPHQIRRIH
jgi:ApaG protein